MIKIKNITDGKRKKKFTDEVPKKKMSKPLTVKKDVKEEFGENEFKTSHETIFQEDLEMIEKSAIEMMKETCERIEVVENPQRMQEPKIIQEEVIEEVIEKTKMKPEIKKEEFEIKKEIKTEEIEIKKEFPKNYREYYLNGYCLRNNYSDQYYAQNETDDEIYWRDSVNNQIYAYKTIQENNSECIVEYPAHKNGIPDYIFDRGGKPRYPVDLKSHKIIFPRDPITNEEIYLRDKKGNLFYPENKYGQQFYRKDLKNNDIPINNIYAQFSNGTQIYPKKENGDQFYLKQNNREVPAMKKKDKISIAYYAMKENGDQIYPREYLE